MDTSAPVDRKQGRGAQGLRSGLRARASGARRNPAAGAAGGAAASGAGLGGRRDRGGAGTRGRARREEGGVRGGPSRSPPGFPAASAPPMAEVPEPEPGAAEGCAAGAVETPGWTALRGAGPQVGAGAARRARAGGARGRVRVI